MKNLKLLIVTVMVFSISVVFSAPAPPPAGGTTTGGTTTVGSPSCWPPPCVPIDNGIVFLIAAGVLYGAKKFYDLRKNAQTLS